MDIEIYYINIKEPDFDKNRFIKNKEIYFTTNYWKQRGIVMSPLTKDKIIKKIKETEYWNNEKNIAENEYGSFCISIDLTEEELFYLKLKYDFEI